MSFDDEIRKEVKDVKNEVSNLKNTSVAYEILHDQRLQNRRMFIAFMLVIILWFITMGIAFYLFMKNGGFKIENITGDNNNTSITDKD